jgi:calcineurin-like phosphoesterase family protein
MTTWFTSDTHFAHANIIQYCGRPFENIEEMNEALIIRWNARVQPEDTVYHLGDFAFGPTMNIKEFREKLNGHITLIRGNHDRTLKRMREFGFNGVVNGMLFSFQGLRLLLTHKPSYDDLSGCDYNLHGHVHETYARRGNAINVGVDVREFEPKTLEELLA